MYLHSDQIELYWESFRKHKHYKVIRDGMPKVKTLSTYSQREIKDLFELNQRLGTTNLKRVNYIKSEALYELERIEKVIGKHKKLMQLYYDLNDKVIFTSNPVVPKQIMADIVRLQVALNIEVNIEYVDAIDKAFDNVYMDLVNHHYVDPYTEENIRRR